MRSDSNTFPFLEFEIFVFGHFSLYMYHKNKRNEKVRSIILQTQISDSHPSLSASLKKQVKEIQCTEYSPSL